jgi:multidrug resistance efflux pump
VELRYAKSELDRASALGKGGAMAEQEHERAEARYRSALAAVRASRVEPAISLRAI